MSTNGSAVVCLLSRVWKLLYRVQNRVLLIDCLLH